MPKKWTQEDFIQKIKEYSNDTITVVGNYVNKKTPVKIECNICHYQWFYSPTSLMPSSQKQYHFKGCPNCKYVETICMECGKPIKILQSRIKENNFCSRECGNRYKNRDKINTIDSTAYRRNAFLYYPHKCKICGWNKDERVLEVHHIDENRNNNDISNLVILCPTCHKYLTLHLYTLEQLLKQNET